MDADLWDDCYLSMEDGRWLAAAQGTLGLYDATLEALHAAIQASHYHTACGHIGRLNGLIRRTVQEDTP